jgi:hypothetical protein
MVQEDKDNCVAPTPVNPYQENTMNAKAVAVPAKSKKAHTRSTLRLSDEEYNQIAIGLRKSKLSVSPINVVVIGAPILNRKFPISEVTDKRISKLNEIIRDMDAAHESHAKAQLTGTIPGVKKGETADLLIKSIVTAAVEAATVKNLEGTRKLLLAQEARFQKQMSQVTDILVKMCSDWGIAVPELEAPMAMPMIEATGQVVRVPRILVYGMQANQKQPLYDHVREWGLQGFADIDIAYSTDAVSTVKRGYDAVIVNRHWVNVDTARELRSHGLKYSEVAGSASAVERQLKLELLDLAISAKQREGRA